MYIIYQSCLQCQLSCAKVSHCMSREKRYCATGTNATKCIKMYEGTLLCLQGLRGSIPANFPYFHVEFNLTKGFVHVIDDEAKFDPQFGRSIMIGLLDLPAEDMHR